MDKMIHVFFNKRICQVTIEDNFETWKRQILLVVNGFNLEGYLLGTILVPPVIDDDDHGNNFVNLDYVKFSQNDSSLASWLLESISSPINTGLVRCMTVASV